MKNYYYVEGLVSPHFSFDGTTMLGNPGMVGDDGEYGSPVALGGLTPEEWLRGYFGDNWR